MVSGCAGGAEGPTAEIEKIEETNLPEAEEREVVEEPETEVVDEPEVESPPEGTNALDLCSKITGFAEKQSCTGKVAEAVALKGAEDAVSICDGSEDTDTCYQRIAPVIAKTDVVKATGLCSGITSQYQDTCYAGVAEAAKDESVCEDASSKDGCYGAVGPVLGKEKGLMACAKVGTFASDACYAALAAEVAKTSQDDALAVCEQTTSDSCYSAVAPVIATKDESKAKELCTEVSSSLQDNCYVDVMEVTKEESICDLVMSTDKCYVAIAPLLSKDKGLEYCAKISFFTDREACIEAVAVEASPDEAIGICDETSEDIDTCYQMIAPVIAKTDVVKATGLCSEITSQYQDTCYAGVAEAATDESVCEDASSKDMCYSAVAPTLA